MADPNLPPTPVKLINPVVLSCIDDMFYRLLFPSLDDLERLINAAGPSAETNMMEFRQGLREELNGQRALDDFAKGWAHLIYWKETRPQTSPGSTSVGQSRSWAARNRSPSPSDTEQQSASQTGGGDGSD